ncbi:MAG: 5,10-methylene tetrahydromethanopterin reductase [Firmicutes bacterium ZCTH02-B6]|mgnify:CR=1 FL=1|nr:MAG: 5,10-methylene tetrahydromethanopterin reductase [Firmicutes bacterium ZCTH02-B6]
MTTVTAVQLSVLDLVPIGTGSSSREALANMVELAQLAEELGYVRFWLAEHHGMPSIASSAPEILIARVAAATRRIRVGAGGVMLPNHAPLRVAEAFHTLNALFPGRIDLGIGRAPGTDPVTSAALRPFDASQFPAQLQELLALSRRAFPPDHPFHGVRVVPEDVELPPVWVLGSSGATAGLAGQLGLGYGFASHFSFDPPGPAIERYRRAFQPSDQFPRPHVIVGATVFCAPTDEEADWLAKSMDLAWVRLRRGEFGRLPSPQEASVYPFTEEERHIVSQHRSLAICGSPERVRAQLQRLADATGADEIMISSVIHDPAARQRSYRLVMEAFAAG